MLKFLIIFMIPGFVWANQVTLKGQARIDAAKEIVIQRTISKSRSELKSIFSAQNLSQISPQHEYCDDDGVSCVTAACSRMPSYACDDESELREIGKACRGNRSGLCLNSMCNHMPSYACDSMDEVTVLAISCRRVRGDKCINDICFKMPSYACDSSEELQRVGRACQGVYDLGCINEVCSRMPSYKCDDIEELEEIAKICRGDI